MTVTTTVFIDNDTMLELKQNITHIHRLPDAFRQILLKGLADFDDEVMPYFEDEEFVAFLKDPKFKNHGNGSYQHVEFPTKRDMKKFQKTIKEAKERVSKTLNLSGIRHHHISRAIFHSWLDEKIETTLTV